MLPGRQWVRPPRKPVGVERDPVLPWRETGLRKPWGQVGSLEIRAMPGGVSSVSRPAAGNEIRCRVVILSGQEGCKACLEIEKANPNRLGLEPVPFGRRLLLGEKVASNHADGLE